MDTAKLLEQLEKIYETKLESALDEQQQPIMQRLYEKILSNLAVSVTANKSFDDQNQLVLYEITYEEEEFATTSSHKDKSRYEFSQKHRQYIEHFFTKHLNSPNHYIKVLTNSIKLDTNLYKKIKYTLYIVLHHV